MPLLSAEDVGDLLSLRTKQVYRLARQGIVPAVRVGRLLRFDPAALDRWIAEGGRGHEGKETRHKTSESQSSASEPSQSRTDC